MYLGEFLTTTKDLEERLSVRLGFAERCPLAEDDRPRHERKSEQNKKNGDGDRPRIQNDVERIQPGRRFDSSRIDLLQ